MIPDLNAPTDRGLHDDAATVIAALDKLAREDDVVLVGHSYGGLAVREAADARADLVRQVVLVDGWAAPDGASLFDLAPSSFEKAMRASAHTNGDGSQIPAPPPAAFGVVDSDAAAWLAERLVPQPLRTFSEATRLGGGVDRVPGTAVCCTPPTYDFLGFGQSVGYRTATIEGPHGVILTDPEGVARSLLEAAA
ncbi:hypothetical protein GCM10009742_06520 [Kribbella karoonensis]|uniref:AB hydrolase-1 domain-containing protein n=1 Tax=Kribbella karoonensis TaxID=324851 RepID=A0ABN2D0E2_9ACTN